MEHRLCKSCLDLLGQDIMYPWHHCHHEEIKPCPACLTMKDINLIRFSYKYTMDSFPCKHCPQCGRKLEKS